MNKKLALLVLTLLTASLVMAPAMALAQNEGGAAAGTAAGGILVVIWMGCVALMVAVGIALFVFWIMMIIDVAKRDESQFPNSTGNSKTVWLIVVILLSYIGAIVYYFVIKRKAPLPK